jgi:hypothetical protein
MANHRPHDSDPFADHAAIDDERDTIIESTLSVGRNATLTLGTDSVIVLGRSLCYLVSKRQSADRFSSQTRAFRKVRAFRALGCCHKVCRPRIYLASECSD